MKALIFGGDKRYDEVIYYFRKKGYIVDVAGEYEEKIEISEYDIIIFPVLGISKEFMAESKHLSVDFLDNSKKNVLIFSGIETPYLKQMLLHSGKNCNYFMKDPIVIKENAVCTVEGIISVLIMNTEITINGSTVMVIGYGNVGKPLVEAFIHLGAKVCVGVKEESDLKTLRDRQIDAFYTNMPIMNEYVKKSDMIVNTVPELVLSKEHTVLLKKYAYVLDISSYPYGIDTDSLEQRNVSYKIYSQIPSKTAPRTSGKILVKKISSILGDI